MTDEVAKFDNEINEVMDLKVLGKAAWPSLA
jgi:hypothetical protein